jgi:hypothetical protein
MQLTACKPTYARRRPETTVLFHLLRDHLESFLAACADDTGRGLPSYVERELRSWFLCGQLGAGFLRARCEACGHSVLVPFSCKSHLCPSCAAARMERHVVHLTERVLPAVPLRLWTVSFPFDLRLLLAADPAFLSFVHGAFVRRALASLERKGRARELALCQGGTVSFIQLFDASLRASPHFHTLIPDGVWALGAQPGSLDFHEISPSAADLEDVALSLALSIRRYLRRRGRLGDDGEILGDDNQDPGALQRLFEQAARDRIPSGRLNPAGDPLPRSSPVGRGPLLREVEGINLHADLRVEAHDRRGRERLVRYGARPPFSHEQFSQTSDGRIAFALRKPRKDGTTHLFFSPLQLLRRLAWLIPRPRVHLLRYAGIFAAGATWRRAVVPRCSPATEEPSDAEAEDLPAARASRLKWAELLARVRDVDALACPRPGCSGRLRLIAAVTDPDAIRRILEHLRLPADLPTLAPARDPPLEP